MEREQRGGNETREKGGGNAEPTAKSFPSLYVSKSQRTRADKSVESVCRKLDILIFCQMASLCPSLIGLSSRKSNGCGKTTLPILRGNTMETQIRKLECQTAPANFENHGKQTKLAGRTCPLTRDRNRQIHPASDGFAMVRLRAWIAVRATCNLQNKRDDKKS